MTLLLPNTALAQFSASGFVRNPAGIPVAGVKIALQSDPTVSTLTDAQGRFTFQHPTVGIHSLNFGQTPGVSGDKLFFYATAEDKVSFQLKASNGKTLYRSEGNTIKPGKNFLQLPHLVPSGKYFAIISSERLSNRYGLAVSEGKYILTGGAGTGGGGLPSAKSGQGLMLEASKLYWHSKTQDVTNGATNVLITLEKLPNIVLILSDDQGWTDYGFMKHAHIKTPNLDKLARENLTFTRGYTPVSLCRPALMSLTTGRYPHQHGVTGNDPVPGPREIALKHIDREVTLQELLTQRKGYASLQTGKWWEGSWQRGKFTAGMTRGDRHGDDGLVIGRQGLGPIPNFIDTTGERPFYLWYAPLMPHTPHDAPQRLVDKYLPLAPTVYVAQYWAMVEWFDETIGQLIQLIEDKGETQNTIIFYTCDNGWLQNLNASGTDYNLSKRSPYDLGIRTPIILKYPGHTTAEMDSSTLVSNIDFMTTMLAAAGITIPSNLPGVNLLDPAMPHKLRPHILGDIYEHDMTDVNNPAATLNSQYIIEGNMKLIIKNARTSSPVTELYNIVADPGERTNLAGSNSATVTRLKGIVDLWYPDSFSF